MYENCENCIEGRPRIGRLVGVTRTLRLAVFEGEGVPQGTPQDLTGKTVVARVLHDGTDDIFVPEFVIEGTSHNVVKFTWPANRQAVGNYTFDVTVTDGSGNVSRVNWHGRSGIRLVAYSNEVYGEDATGVKSNDEIGLIGYFTTSGEGMSAYEEWLASDESEGYERTVDGFFEWMRKPASDAAAAAEAQMTDIQSRADEDHRIAGADHQTASEDHTRAENDHTRAEGDHTTAADDHRIAAADHSTATEDHRIAGEDHSTAVDDNTRAGQDHDTAAEDHRVAGVDHGTAVDDHTRAGQDHQTASDDHTQAGSDHTRAGEDHTRAGDDHTTAGNDHTRAGEDHITAGNDHTRAGEDHTQAGNDHTRAEADHEQAVSDHQTWSSKADKDTDAVEGNIAAFDANGNPVDGGIPVGYISQLGQKLNLLVNPHLAYHQRINVDGAKYGYYNYDGTIAYSATRRITEYIYIGGLNKLKIISGAYATSATKVVCCVYDAGLNFISSILYIVDGQQSYGDVINYEFNLPGGACYVSICLPDANTICVLEDISNSDILSYSSFENGYILPDGTIQSSDTRGVTDYIPIFKYKKIKIISGVASISGGGAHLAFGCLFNKNKELITPLFYPIQSDNIINFEIDIPDGAYYARFTLGGNSWVVNFEYEKHNSETPTTTFGQFIYNDGSVRSSSTRSMFSLPVSFGDFIKVHVHQEGDYLGTGASIISFWKDNVFVLNYLTGNNGADYDESLTIPSGVNKIIVSSSNVGEYDVSITKDNTIRTKSQYQQLFKPQIKNNCLPIKSLTEELNILLIGSSFGVDTISGLSQVAANVGVKVNTGNLYLSSGGFDEYLTAIANNTAITFYYNDYDGNETALSKTVYDAIKYKSWDIIILMNSADDSLVDWEGINTDCAKILKYVRSYVTNQRCVFALNNTWTERTKMNRQDLANNIAFGLSMQSGIDIVLPNGAAISNLRKTSVNDGNDIYRDGVHLNVGVGRFTTACVLFFCLVSPVFNVDLDNCTFTGAFPTEGGIGETYPRINVTDANRGICINCAFDAVNDKYDYAD